MKKYLLTLLILFATVLTIKAQQSSADKQQSSGHATSKENLNQDIEQHPEFPGGLKKFYQYLSRNINYPREDRKKKIEGTVFMSFVVEKDGRLTDVFVTKGVSPQIDAEAVRVISASPKWNPGIQFGKPIRVRYNINVNFKL